MSLIDLDTARAHLRVESDYPADQIEPYLFAAELSATNYLNRGVFADANALSTAVAAVPGQLTTARTDYEAAMTAAEAIEDTDIRAMATEAAGATYRRARASAQEIYDSTVTNAAIQAAILLILGHLFENRQDVQSLQPHELPMGSVHLLFPYRVGLGV